MIALVMLVMLVTPVVRVRSESALFEMNDDGVNNCLNFIFYYNYRTDPVYFVASLTEGSITGSLKG